MAADGGRPQTLILGAGPTGLGVAAGLALCDYPGEVTVVERRARPGGLAGSYSWKEHTIDFGPHRLSPAIPIVRVLADELLGPDRLIKKSQHGVQFKGKLYQFPPRVRDWIAPSSALHLGAFAASFFATKAEWVVSRFDSDTFETTVARKFGRRFHDLIAAPMAEKVWVDPRRVDPAFVDQRFAPVEPYEVLKAVVLPRQELNPSTFYYPRRGFQQLWDNLTGFVERRGQRVRLGARPVRMEVEGGRIVRVEVIDADGGTRTFEGPDLTVVSTIPLPSLLDLMPSPEFDVLRARSRSVAVRSMLLVAFEFDVPRALPYRTLIFPERDFSFNRLFEQNEYSRETVAADHAVVVADVTLPRGDERMARPDAEIVASVRRELERLPYIPTDRIVDAHVERVEFAYVVPDVDSRRTMHGVTHALKTLSNLILMGRFAVGEYDNSDYALDNGLTVASYIAGKISAADYYLRIYEKKGRSILG